MVPIPINLDTINKLYGLNLTSFELKEFFASVAVPKDYIRTAEDVVVSKVGRELYETFFRGYSRKQWGIDPCELDKSVTARVPTRTNRDDRYFTDTYQAMPGVNFVGRLATYKYYNMDQVVAQALTLYNQLSRKPLIEVAGNIGDSLFKSAQYLR